MKDTLLPDVTNRPLRGSIHYLGDLSLTAVRSCVRQAWNGGAPRSGKCTIAGTGLLNGEPRMSLN